MSSIGDRVREVRKKNGWRQLDLALKIGVSEATIGNLESGRTSKPETVHKIAELTGVEYDWLWTGNSAISPHSNMVRIPILDIQASCGDGVLVPDQEEIYNVLTVPKEWIRVQLGINDIANHKIIYASGDSMEPTFTNGDLLVINLGDIDLRDGLWLLRIDDHLYAKRIQVTVGRKAITLISDNNLYPQQTIDLQSTEVNVIGRIANSMSIKVFK